jgi:NAD(P)-dependent dehydrogenase (short-subunit alcohol dehydrogenase family)
VALGQPWLRLEAASPEEVADLVLFLASDRTASVTGADWPIAAA